MRELRSYLHYLANHEASLAVDPRTLGPLSTPLDPAFQLNAAISLAQGCRIQIAIGEMSVVRLYSKQ